MHLRETEPKVIAAILQAVVKKGAYVLHDALGSYVWYRYVWPFAELEGSS